MPVNQRGETWQAAVTVNGKRLRATFDTRKDAIVWEAQAKADLLAGREVVVPLRKASPKPKAEENAAGVHTLGDFVGVVYRSRWHDKKAASTALRNATDVADVLGRDRLVSSLGKADALKVKEHFRAKGRTVATINRKLAALSTLVTEAVEWGHLPSKFKVGLTRVANGRVRVVEPKEEATMLAWCRTWAFDDMHDYIATSLDIGWRQGECLKLEARDLRDGEVYLHDTKSGSNRLVPLTPRTKAILERRKQGKQPTDRLFPMPKKRIEIQWAKVCAGVGIDREVETDFVPHCMRHSFCSRLFAAGVDAKTVMELAGHSNLATTQRYSHSSPERKSLAVARLSAFGVAAE